MKRFALPLLAAALVSACSDQKSARPAPEAGAAQPAPTAVASPTTTASAAGPASRYTSLKDCKVVEDGGGEDWSVSRCAGLGGYDLLLNYGDARESLAVLRQGKQIAELNLSLRGGGGFNAVGETAEWRGAGEGAQFAPRTLIVRNIIHRDPDRPERTTELLEVFDLQQACSIGSLEPGSDQNAAARKIADEPKRACL